MKRFKSLEKHLERPAFNWDVLLGPHLDFICTDVSNVDDVIRLYGLTREGHTICVKVKDFEPYFFAMQSNSYDLALLETGTRESTRIELEQGQTCIKYMEPIYTYKPLLGYRPPGSAEVPMNKITMGSTKFVATCRELLKKNNVPTYEGNIPFNLRFMVDKGFGGMDWIRVLEYYRVRDQETRCQIEVEAKSHHYVIPEKTCSDLNSHLRVLYFDLEIVKAGKGYQGPKVDPIIIISLVLVNGNYEVLDRRLLYFTDKEVSAIPDDRIELEVFKFEHSMLQRFRDYVELVDPDILSGYNIDGYDLPYLYERAEALKIDKYFIQNSRDKERGSYLKKNTFNSTATGKRKDYDLICEGRFAFDVLKFIKNPANRIKLRSYKLGNVSEHFLGKTKVEMPYNDIPRYYHGTPEQRAHLGYYGWYDSELCNDLMQRFMALIDYTETARVSGTPMKFLMSRGTQILTMSLLLRYARRRGFVVPSSTDNQNDEETEGATVLTPVKGFHEEKDPVVTLDFQSLYPSIIMDDNICYCTKVPLSWARKNLKEDQYNVIPGLDGNFCFVDEDVLRGLLAEMQAELFALRLKAKAELKNTKDPQLKQVLDRRQNAIKTRMNAIYGFLKANMVCDKDLMSAVTARGRWMIENTKRIVEENFTDAQVIYGDTDSVFIKFKGRTLEQAFELGEKAAAMCTDFFNLRRRARGRKDIHKLQCEKAFLGFLLIGKKKYAGRKYMTLHSKPELSSSGLETVRRDNALIGSETQEECLRMIVMEGDSKGKRCIELVHERISLLLRGKIPIHKLIISKNLSKSIQEYEDSNSTQIHVELAKRINARKDETGEEEITIGDRVKYVIIKGEKGAKISQLAEDPLYALQHRIPIDYEYYIFRQMMKPLLKILIPVICPEESYKKTKEEPVLQSNNLSSWAKVNPKKKEEKESKKPDTDKTFLQIQKLKTYKVLFTGDHMGSIIQRSGETKGISSWVKKSKACLSCGCNLGFQSKDDVCKHCDKEKAYKEFEVKMDELKKDEKECWDRCRVCVGDKVESLECANTDCDNFYQRQKVLIDIEDLASKRVKPKY